jgi:hypothetical protein
MNPVGPGWRDRTFRALIEDWVEGMILSACAYCGSNVDRGDACPGMDGLDVDVWLRDPRDGDGMDHNDIFDIEDFITASTRVDRDGRGVAFEAQMRITVEIRDLSASQTIFAKEVCDVVIIWDGNGIRMEGFPDFKGRVWWNEVVKTMHDDGEDRSRQREAEGMDVVHARKRWMILVGNLEHGWEAMYRTVLDG